MGNSPSRFDTLFLVFSKYKDNDFYHVRYGRGAIILAVKSPKDARRKNKINSDKHVAQVFASREQNLDKHERLYLDSIESVEESNGIVKIRFKFDRSHDG